MPAAGAELTGGARRAAEAGAELTGGGRRAAEAGAELAGGARRAAEAPAASLRSIAASLPGVDAVTACLGASSGRATFAALVDAGGERVPAAVRVERTAGADAAAASLAAFYARAAAAGVAGLARPAWIGAARGAVATIAPLADEDLASRPPADPDRRAAAVSRIAATVAALHAAGLAHGRVHAGNALFGPGGDVRLADAAPWRAPSAAGDAAGLAALAAAAGIPVGAGDVAGGAAAIARAVDRWRWRARDPDLAAIERAGWRVRARLGSGASADVYEVERDGDVRALKLFRPGHGGGRQRRLADLLDRLRRHRNAPFVVPEVVDATPSGRLYVVMERHDATLSAAAADMDARVRIDALCEVARALGQLHRLGIVHRDVKPSNVLVSAGGSDGRHRVVLADFGLAVAAGDRPGDRAAGTPGYRPPESLSEQPVDPAWDMWSFGALAVRVLGGASVDDRVDARALRRRARRLRGASRPLRRALVRCLAARPSRRPAAEEMIAILARELRPPARRWPHRAAVAAVASAAAVAVAAAVGGAREPRPSREPAAAAEPAALAEQAAAVAAREPWRAAALARRSLQRRPTAAGWRAAAAVARQLLHLQGMHLHTSPVVAARFSPDGAYLATATRAGEVALWPVAGGRPRRHVAVDGVAALGFADDGVLWFRDGRGATWRWSPPARPRCAPAASAVAWTGAADAIAEVVGPGGVLRARFDPAGRVAVGVVAGDERGAAPADPRIRAAAEVLDRLLADLDALRARAAESAASAASRIEVAVPGAWASLPLVRAGARWVLESEVTQAQYVALTGENPSPFVDPGYPVTGVACADADRFARALEARTGLALRLLPAELWARLRDGAGVDCGDATGDLDGVGRVDRCPADRRGLRGIAGGVREWLVPPGDRAGDRAPAYCAVTPAGGAPARRLSLVRAAAGDPAVGFRLSAPAPAAPAPAAPAPAP
ncbi:MAG: hypothetical protein D6689_21870, partial [Deltaproteobacteria bacterium]